MNLVKALSGSIFGSLMPLRAPTRFGAKSAGLWGVKCVRSDGSIRWEDDFHNIVVNTGLDHILDVVLSGGTQDTTWFVGLLAASPSVNSTWTTTEIDANDFVDYSEAALQAFVDSGVSGQSLDNSASTADFSINSDSSSIGGAFLITDNSKGTSSGTLYSAGAFSGGNKAADNGDTLQVTATFTQADDGV